MNSVSVDEVCVSRVGARARSRLETRRRLVAAATQLFARQGLRRTTTVQIARAAEVAAGTFYLHFADKHALFREIALDALGRLRQRMNQASEALAPRSALTARMAELLAFAEEHRDLIQILFGPGQQAGAIGEEILDALFADLEAGLRERIAEGLVDPALHPGATAQALLASWTRVVAWWIQDPRRADRDAVVRTLTRLHPLSHSSQT